MAARKLGSDQSSRIALMVVLLPKDDRGLPRNGDRAPEKSPPESSRTTGIPPPLGIACRPLNRPVIKYIRRWGGRMPRGAKKMAAHGGGGTMGPLAVRSPTGRPGNAMSSEGSVTRWVTALKGGDLAAAQPLWERYHRRLVALA